MLRRLLLQGKVEGDGRNANEVLGKSVGEVPVLEVTDGRVAAAVRAAEGQRILGHDVARDLDSKALHVLPASNGALLLKGADDKGEDGAGGALGVGEGQLLRADLDVKGLFGGVELGKY
jgi:hypothetical protein